MTATNPKIKSTAPVARTEKAKTEKNTVRMYKVLQVQLLDCRSGAPLKNQPIQRIDLDNDPKLAVNYEGDGGPDWDILTNLRVRIIESRESRRQAGDAYYGDDRKGERVNEYLAALGFQIRSKPQEFRPDAKAKGKSHRKPQVAIDKGALLEFITCWKDFAQYHGGENDDEKYNPLPDDEEKTEQQDEKEPLKWTTAAETHWRKRIIAEYNRRFYLAVQFYLKAFDPYNEVYSKAEDDNGKWGSNSKNAFRKFQKEKMGRRLRKNQRKYPDEATVKALLNTSSKFVSDEFGRITISVPLEMMKSGFKLTISFRDFTTVVEEGKWREYHTDSTNQVPTGFDIVWKEKPEAWKQCDDHWGWYLRFDTQADVEFKCLQKFVIPGVNWDDPNLAKAKNKARPLQFLTDDQKKQARFSPFFMKEYEKKARDHPEIVLFCLVWCQPVWDGIEDPSPPKRVNEKVCLWDSTEPDDCGRNMHIVTTYFDLNGSHPHGGKGYGIYEYEYNPKWRGPEKLSDVAYLKVHLARLRAISRWVYVEKHRAYDHELLNDKGYFKYPLPFRVGAKYVDDPTILGYEKLLSTDWIKDLGVLQETYRHEISTGKRDEVTPHIEDFQKWVKGVGGPLHPQDKERLNRIDENIKNKITVNGRLDQNTGKAIMILSSGGLRSGDFGDKKDGHQGLDIHARKGCDPVFALHGGKLTWQTGGAGGRAIRIAWDGPPAASKSIQYLHLDDREDALKNKRVRAGQIIGIAGRTGNLYKTSHQPGHVHLNVGRIWDPKKNDDVINHLRRTVKDGVKDRVKDSETGKKELKLVKPPDPYNAACIPHNDTPLLFPCYCEVTLKREPRHQWDYVDPSTCKFSNTYIVSACWAVAELKCPHMPKEISVADVEGSSAKFNAKLRLQAQLRYLYENKGDPYKDPGTLDGVIPEVDVVEITGTKGGRIRRKVNNEYKPFSPDIIKDKGTKWPFLGREGIYYKVQLGDQVGYVNKTVSKWGGDDSNTRKAIKEFRVKTEGKVVPGEPECFKITDDVIKKLNHKDYAPVTATVTML